MHQGLTGVPVGIRELSFCVSKVLTLCVKIEYGLYSQTELESLPSPHPHRDKFCHWPSYFFVLNMGVILCNRICLGNFQNNTHKVLSVMPDI